MANELRESLVIDLKGNLEKRAKRWGRSIDRFSRDSQRDLGRLTRATNRFGNSIGGLANRWTGLLSGAAAVAAIRQVGRFDDRLTRLGIAADVSDEKLEKLKHQIFETANAGNIRVDPSEITHAIQAIIDKTGDLEFAERNIRNIGVAIQATNAAGTDIGEILGEFQKMDIKAPDQVLRAIDILNVQGKEGAFTLQNIAKLGPRVINAYTAAGRGGVGALREMGAALQMIRKGTGSSEMAATAFEATMRTIQDPAKQKKLADAGINVYKQLENGKKMYRAINEIMADIVQTAGGDISKIGSIFDAEAVRAFNSAAGEFNRTGELASLQQYYSVQADGTQTMKDAARGAQTFGAAWQTLTNATERFADNNLSEPVQDIADAINSVDSDQFQRWMELAKNLALIGGGIWALGKIGNVMSRRRGGGAGGATGAAGALGGSMTPVPVFVVNGGFGGVPGGGAPQTSGRRTGPGRRTQNLRTPRRTGFDRAGRAAGAVPLLGQAALAGYGVGELLNEFVYNPLATALTGRENTLGTAIAELVHETGPQMIEEYTRRFTGGESGANNPLNGEVGGVLDIRLTQDGRVLVDKMESKGLLAMKVNTGPMMPTGQ